MDAHTPTPTPPPRRRRPARSLRRFSVAAVAVASCALVSGGIAVASAEGSGHPTATHVRQDGSRAAHGAIGTVTTVEGSTLVLSTHHGTDLTVTTSDATSFRV